jgi:hypothetical protein
MRSEARFLGVRGTKTNAAAHKIFNMRLMFMDSIGRIALHRRIWASK